MKEKIKIWLLALLMFAIVFVIVNPVKGQSSQAKDHAKMQSYYSFDRWERDQPKVRIKAVKDAVKQSKAIKGKNNQSARLVRKENRIRKHIIK
jgi:hypothetical protein